MEINVINMQKEPVETLELPDAIASAEANPELVYEMVRQYQAGGRQGTHKTKGRGEVSGSGRKLWKQKGTGRARIGSIRSPLWRHGGTVHGPQPRDYSYSVPTRKRIAALRSVIAEKMKNNSFFVINEISFENPKSKSALEFLKTFELTNRTLFVDSLNNKNLQLSIRNLPNAKFCSVATLNIVDALKYRNVVISKPAFAQLSKILAR
jgi:large subunit ribosomal protein L4